jgi:NRPS condensation-like uncharacterized protein
MVKTSMATNPPDRVLTPLERRFTRSPYYLVTMTVRINGYVSAEMLSSAVSRIQQRHAVLRARIVDDAGHNPTLVHDGADDIPVEVVTRESENHWIQVYHRQYKIPFDFDKRPPIRFLLVQADDVSELVIFCHHIICDGKSLAYLARDIMVCLGDPDYHPESLPAPPPISASTMPADVRANSLVRYFINRINRKWQNNRILFDQEDYKSLVNAYWSRFSQKMVPVEWSEQDTTELVKQCRAEGVTVNSALMVAFIGAETIVRGAKSCESNMGVIGSVRNRLQASVGEAMGFYAGHVELKFRYRPGQDFWENVRRFHRTVKPMLTDKGLFREALLYEYLDPTLIEATAFKMEGGLVPEGDDRFEKLSAFRNRADVVSKILKRRRVDTPERVIMDTAITNLTNMDFPRRYGDLELDRLYMNPGISARYNLVLGAVTCAGKLSLVVAHIEEKVDSGAVDKIIKLALELLI